jgi:serine O-acetyltransferase
MPTTSTAEKVWKGIRAESEKLIKQDPFCMDFIEDMILSRKSFPESLAAVLAVRLSDGMVPRTKLEPLLRSEMLAHPTIVESAAIDLQAVIERDPACNSLLEPLIFFKGFQALQAHRVAHSLWKGDRRFAALMVQSIVSRKFAVDIHPAAQIGHGILLDHATNFVVGETATIGNNVSILHGVSLGGNGKEKGDRHPKVGDGVMIGAHAQLLGNIRIGKGAKIGAGAVVLQSVPAHTTVAGVPAVKVGRSSQSVPALEMQQNFTEDAP